MIRLIRELVQNSKIAKYLLPFPSIHIESIYIHGTAASLGCQYNKVWMSIDCQYMANKEKKEKTKTLDTTTEIAGIL